MKTLLTRWGSVFQLFGLRGWMVAAAAGAAVTWVVIGVTSAIIDNPFFLRMTPTRTQDYIIWALTGVLAGFVAGTFTLPARNVAGGRAASGGLLSFLAVGCPVCNKLVLLLLGASGALTFFAPLQIYIGIASLGLLAWSLHLRVRTIYGSGCAVSQVAKARETGIKNNWDDSH